MNRYLPYGKSKMLFFVLTIFILYFLFRQNINLLIKSNKPIRNQSELNELNFPTGNSLNKVIYSINNILRIYQNNNIPFIHRNLIIFHIGDIGLASNSIDIAANNVKIFVESFRNHSNERSTQRAFYLFNVVDSLNNPLATLLPLIENYQNLGILEWEKANSDIDTHYRTLNLLGNDIILQFHTIIFLNQGVRGPLAYQINGEWINEINKLIYINNVALVGPMLSCQISPHIQTHAFALKSVIVPLVLKDMEKNMKFEFKSWKALIKSLEVGLTTFVLKAGYNISSLLYYHEGYSYFNTHSSSSTRNGRNSKCIIRSGSTYYDNINPTSWCILDFKEVIFLKWGGEAIRTYGVYCNKTVIAMEDYLYDLSRTKAHLELIVPETLKGGYYYNLYKEYNKEIFIDRKHHLQLQQQQSIDKLNDQSISTSLILIPKVCFMVRITSIDQIKPTNHAYSKLINKDVELLITTLRRQTNPNWQAYFFIIHNKQSIENKLQQLLNNFSDIRLNYIPLKTSYQDMYNIIDAGYTVTDIVLNMLLHRPECEWVSLTAGDNAYGSEIVQRVLNVTSPVDMVISPLDSRRYLQHDQIISNRRPTKYEPTNPKYSFYCEQMDAMLRYNYFTYAIRPIPKHENNKVIESSAVFLSRNKLYKENLFFRNFTNDHSKICIHNITDPVGYPCFSNQASKLISYLHSNKHWVYKRLPLDGIKSVVFHGNSPTLCIASGHVWLDHPDPQKAKCISHTEVYNIGLNNHENYKYDYHYFYEPQKHLGSDRTCLRLSYKYFMKYRGK